MIEVEVSYVILCIHSILNCTLGSFGHPALECVIGGLRVENYIPLILKHDKGCSCTHIFLQIYCHASVCALLQQKGEFAGRDGPSAIWCADRLQRFG